MPVEGLQANNVSSSAIQLTWHPPTHSNGPITNYFLYWSSDDMPGSHMTIPANLHQFVLHSLLPYTVYSIAVSVANTAGRSENRSLTVRTPEAGTCFHAVGVSLVQRMCRSEHAAVVVCMQVSLNLLHPSFGVACSVRAPRAFPSDQCHAYLIIIILGPTP